MEEIKAKYYSTIFSSNENGFCIFCYENTGKNPIPEEAEKSPSKFSRKSTFVAIGYFLPNEGEFLLKGDWESNSKYGTRLKVSEIEEIIPNETDQIVKWLLIGKYKGMRKKTAEKLVAKFGTDTINVIENEPDKIISFMGEIKGTDFINSYNEKHFVRKVMPIVEKYSIHQGLIKKIYDLFSRWENGIELIKERPYLLCEVNGVNFKKIDAVVKKEPNFDPYNKDRIQFGTSQILWENELEGHLYIPVGELLSSMVALFGIEENYAKMMINEMVKAGRLIFQCGVVFSRPTFEHEDGAAKKLVDILRLPLKCKESKIEELISKQKKLDDVQKSGVRNALTHRVSIITGGPGRGKTTTLKAVVDIFKEINPHGEIKLCAPSGRAACRMMQSTDLPAVTIHELLKITPDLMEVTENSLSVDLLIVDEVSMCDQELFYLMLKALERDVIILLVGDKNQLPSVGAGDVLKELIRSRCIPVTFLEKIYRQEEGNSIIENSKRIEDGNPELIYDESFQLIPCYDKEHLDAWLEYLTKNETSDYQVLSPLRKNKEFGTSGINILLQEKLNPLVQGQPAFEKHGISWRKGDKVMHLKNSSGLNNGDLGMIDKVVQTEDGQGIEVMFQERGLFKTYIGDDMDELELAYALTVHKMQGSECDTVILVFPSQAGRMRQKRLFYTAVTRAKKKVIILGDQESINLAIKNAFAETERRTFFADRIVTYYAEGL